MRVLVVEDEELMASSLRKGLERAGFAVDVARDGASGLATAQARQYDVVVLDRDLPRLHGDELCRRLREAGDPVLVMMLTASGSVDDRIHGLGLGADDYLPKPFSFPELLARLHALLRRPRGVLTPVLRVGALEIDAARMTATREGRDLGLGTKEFGVLLELARAQGALVSAEELLERVWDRNIDPFSNVVRVAVATLRAKLGAPPLIQTVRGAGYRLVP